jgi:hypothetical protein
MIHPSYGLFTLLTPIGTDLKVTPWELIAWPVYS